MTKLDLVKEAFYQLNGYKRHRALQQIESSDKREFHELQMYRNVDKLELALRAIQKQMRMDENTTDTESEEE